ncbi:MAG: phosphatase PAP2 family protein [Eubacterium sp.]|nr:phosphatase PAP2 family protein [Eubacterium sp.]
MKKSINRKILIPSIIIYLVLFALMIFASVNGGKYDLIIDKNVFNPDLTFPKLVENFGQFVYWGMWGPAFAVIFICKRDLNGCLNVIGKLFPFVKPFKNIQSKAYKFFDFVLKFVETLGFFVLCGIGWKKLIENVIKNILYMLDKDNLSQIVYFVISFIVAALSILLIKRFDKEKLEKLEYLALSGVLLGIFYKIVEECKTITHRVRFREMVAYSNGFFNDEGLSEGKYSPLSQNMVKSTDFGAFTPWYHKASATGAYDYHLFSRTDSFPSGHTTYSCTLFLSVLFCSAFDRLKKFAPFAFCVSVVFVGVVGYTRMVAGAHYLSDVVGAMIIGFTLFLIVRQIYNNFTQKNILD